MMDYVFGKEEKQYQSAIDISNGGVRLNKTVVVQISSMSHCINKFT